MKKVKMKKIVVAGIFLAPLMMPLMTQADAAAGKAKSATCAACHGANGIAIADIYPNIAGQKKGYLESSLKAYRDGVRTGGNAALMASMVAALSDQDIKDLADYYSGM